MGIWALPYDVYFLRKMISNGIVALATARLDNTNELLRQLNISQGSRERESQVNDDELDSSPAQPDRASDESSRLKQDKYCALRPSSHWATNAGEE